MARMPGSTRMRTASALAVALASAVGLAWPGEAQAEPRDERPWGRGVSRPTFGLSPWGLFDQEIASLSFGVGINYFIVNGLSVGVGVSDTIFIYRSAFKAYYPGIETALPTNMLEVTPSLQYVFFRSRRFSPYVYAGVGPVFLNHGAGTYGQWVAGPGALFNVAGPLYVSVGVGFSGLFPGDRCTEALTYQPAEPAGSVTLDLCSFRWGPQVGLGLAFGGGKRGRNRRESQPERRELPPPEPARNPLDEAVQAEPEPPPAESPPTSVAEPPPADAPPADAPPPSVAEPPPADAPPPSAVTDPPAPSSPSEVVGPPLPPEDTAPPASDQTAPPPP